MGLDTTKWVNARGCQKLAGFSMRITNPGSPFYQPTDRFVRSWKRGMWQKCTPPWGVGRWMHVSGGHLLSIPHVNLILSCHHDCVWKLNCVSFCKTIDQLQFYFLLHHHSSYRNILLPVTNSSMMWVWSTCLYICHLLDYNTEESVSSDISWNACPVTLTKWKHCFISFAIPSKKQWSSSRTYSLNVSPL